MDEPFSRRTNHFHVWTQKEMLDVARRWHAALKRQVDEQIRKRFEAVFETAHVEKD